MKKLLISTDFSAAAIHASEYGYQLATQIAADVVLCNAFIVPADMPQAGLVVWPMLAPSELQNETEAELSDAREHLSSTVNLGTYVPKLTSIGTKGRFTDVVEDLVESEKITMIVMATHGKGFGQFMLGNHTRNLIDCTTIPLLIVPPSATIKTPKKIAFATDLVHPKEDLDIIFDLIPMAKLLGADILVAHISHGNENASKLKKQVEQFLNEISDKADYPKIYYSDVLNEQTESGLDMLMLNSHIDILAMVHRHHHFLERLLVGSHTQKMADHISIPLLVFPSNAIEN